MGRKRKKGNEKKVGKSAREESEGKGTRGREELTSDVSIQMFLHTTREKGQLEPKEGEGGAPPGNQPFLSRLSQLSWSSRDGRRRLKNTHLTGIAT